MNRAFVILFMIVVATPVWLVLRVTGILDTVNHDVALWLGSITSSLSGAPGWWLVKLFQKKTKMQEVQIHQVNQD